MMLGISVYLSEPLDEKQIEYIKKMNKSGFTSIFTSLHIPEDDPSLYKDRLQQLGKLALQENMELFADISPKSLEHLGYTWENAAGLKDWGLTGLRVDYGISEPTIAKLSREMKIALNASTLTDENLENLKLHGMDFSAVEAWHNFYPRPETGLDYEEFNQKNKWLKEAGIQVMAFIPGDGTRRGPLYKGLPTLEDHREVSPFAAFLDFQSNPWVDKILVGDPTISDIAMEQFETYHQGTILLRAHSFITDNGLKKHLSNLYTNRLDAARDVIRAAESRLYASYGDGPISPENTFERPMGSITLDNSRYGRYQGEIQITKRGLPKDEKVNVLGRVIEDDLPLLKNIKGGVKFLIKWVN